MAKLLESFEAGAAIDDIVEALNRDGGVIMLNPAPPELMDEVYDETLRNTPRANARPGATSSGRKGTRPLALEIGDRPRLQKRGLSPITYYLT